METEYTLRQARLPARSIEIMITVLGLMGAVFGLLFYERAFPLAALDIDLTRAEISQRAWQYMQAQGYGLEDYQFAQTFGYDWWALNYVQSVLGVSAANQRVREDALPLWYWHARWFRPSQEEEFSLYLAPDGEVVALFHNLAEDTPGASLSQEEARALAETYLTQDRGWNLADWELSSSSSQEQPRGRVDHGFEWKRRGFTLGESELRLRVGVQGDRVSAYDYWLKIPDSFWRGFVGEHDLGFFLDDLCYWIGFAGLGVAVVVAYICAIRRGALSWRAGLWPAVVVGGVALLVSANNLSLAQAWYCTSGNYTLFWLEQILYMLLDAATLAITIAVLWTGARYLGKLVWPRQDKILPRGGDPWSMLARSTWRGLMLSGVMSAYTVLFYIVAQALGARVPLSVGYGNLLSTPFPFLGPIADGLFPAITEEFLFRLAGIALILWWTRRSRLPQGVRYALALLVPGLLWACAHLSYVREPYYLRGIELLISAVFLEGLAFLYFDLTTVFVAHFAFNALGSTWLLLRSGEPYPTFSGLLAVAILLAPIMPGLVRALRRRLRGEQQEPPPVRIREAGEGDLAGLAALPLDIPDWAGLISDPAVVVLMLRVGEQLAGAAIGRIRADGCGQVEVVYVASRWRRRYWGSALAEQLQARLQRLGAQEIGASVEKGDRVSTAFWANLGWELARQVFASRARARASTGQRDGPAPATLRAR